MEKLLGFLRFRFKFALSDSAEDQKKKQIITEIFEEAARKADLIYNSSEEPPEGKEKEKTQYPQFGFMNDY